MTPLTKHEMSLPERLECHALDLEEERGKGLAFVADIREAARKLNGLGPDHGNGQAVEVAHEAGNPQAAEPRPSGAKAVEPDRSRLLTSNEQFKDAPPLANRGWKLAEVERDIHGSLPHRIGQLYVGKSFFTVAEARLLRNYLNEVLPDETTAEHSVQEAAIYQAGYEHGQRDARMPAVETSAPLQCVCGEVRVWAYTTKIETATSIHYPDKPCHQRDPEHVKATACIHIWTVSGRIGNPLPDQLCDHGCGLRYADRFAVNGGEKHDL